MKEAAFLYALAFWLAFIGMSGASAQDEVDLPVDLPPEYRHCHEVLWSPPMTTLKDFVPKGYGARVSTGDLEDYLKGLRCSDEQLIAYMEYHGLPYENTVEAQNFVDTGWGGYNRLINFCVKSPSLLDRLIFGRCGGVTRFMMIDDKVSYIISHGGK